MGTIQRTGLYDAHIQAGAKIVEFAGYEMPVMYSSIREEHEAVRTTAGIFDVSHMGEIVFKGPDALKNVQNLVTNDVAKIPLNRVVYSGLLYKQGTFVDDLLVYKVKEDHYLLCVNASNCEKDFNWMKSNLQGDLTCENVSNRYTQIAVQGPQSINILQKLTATSLANIKYYRFVMGEVDGIPTIISRTGYTGEIGFELYFDPSDSMKMWNKIMEIGRPLGLKPAGLGCRDTLRLEAGMALYGNDIDDQHTPLEANLEWIVKMDKPSFIGKEILENQLKYGLKRQLVGFELTDRGIPRHGYEIFADGKKIGEVTSGTMSITLNKSIGLGYVDIGRIAEGSVIQIKIRDKFASAKVVRYPFYSKTH